MANSKKVQSKPRGPDCWEEDDINYPCRRGICEFCGKRDDLKESFDRVRYICKNASACVLRWKKSLIREAY